MRKHTEPSPAPGSLGALLRPQLSPQPPKSAADVLAQIPEVVDMSAWYEQHIALLHQFLHRALKVVANTPSKRNAKLVKLIGTTHAELTLHTRKIAGDAIPVVLSRDGKYPIPFERLAEARAKVQVLTAELAQARDEVATLKVEGWRPAFDVMSPRQEELVMQFCQEIAGPRGEPGRPGAPAGDGSGLVRSRAS